MCFYHFLPQGNMFETKNDIQKSSLGESKVILSGIEKQCKHVYVIIQSEKNILLFYKMLFRKPSLFLFHDII